MNTLFKISPINYLLVCLLAISVIVNGQDTFSIVAVDTITGEVGSAGASCLDDDDIEGGVFIISDVHPGVGVIHTQSLWHPSNQDYARQLMNDGLSPAQIIDSLVANDVYNNPAVRQYGIVDLSGDSARASAFTGENCYDYKNHILGPNYAIQGNILLGQEILDSMEARFLNTDGDLSCKLMAALQGANVVGADTRCTPYGVSSLSAFVRVAHPTDDIDNLYCDILVGKVLPGVDPIDSLQTLFDDWGGCWMTAVSETGFPEKVSVYPNPAAQSVTFQFDEDCLNTKTSIIVVNAGGRMVHQAINVSTKKEIWNTERLPAGIYFYRIIQNGVTLDYGKIILK